MKQHTARLRLRWPCMASVMLPVYLAMTSVLDVILECSASHFVRQRLAHQRIFPGNDTIPDVILPCSASQFMQAYGSPENQMALHDSCHDASSPGNDILLDVLLQCSEPQVVQKHMAHQKTTWPCLTCVMLPVHLAMTSFPEVILQCSAAQFVQQHMAHLRSALYD